MFSVRSCAAASALALTLAASLTFAGGASAAYPGANGELAFTSTQDGGARHIFVQTASGITDLTGVSAPDSETQPKFSPDGREIAFTRTGPGIPNSEIFVMSAAGAERTQLTKTPQGNSDPTWSPDGTQLAFVSERSDQIPQIYVMSADGTRVRKLTTDTAGKSELAWSPKGDRIAFVHVPAGGGDREIYSIRTDGTGLTDLSNDPSNYDVDPAWSPDGAKIVYSGPHHPRGSVGADLWLMNADGTGQQALEHENNGYSDGGYPAWSPDGSTIAFGANNGSGYYHVWSVPATGGQNIELVTNHGTGGNPVDQEVDWQPITPVPATEVRATVSRRTRAAKLTFVAPGATHYRCKLRRGKRTVASKSCSGSVRYAHLKPGKYAFVVLPTGPGGPYHAGQQAFRI
jgi:Tol biopolymer transport system component